MLLSRARLCTLAAVLVAAGISGIPADAATTQASTCVDAAGRAWMSKVVWGEEYTDGSGLRRLRLVSAGWTTAGHRVPTHAVVRTYSGARAQVQELAWSGSFDYRGAGRWRSVKPVNPAAAPGISKVTLSLGQDGSGEGGCTTTFRHPVLEQVDPSAAKWWSADLTGIPVGPMNCDKYASTATVLALRKQWNHWDNCGGTVVSPAAEGLPAPPGSRGPVVRWRKPAGDPNVYQKLNRTFTRANWPVGGTDDTTSGSPPDVSARYQAYLYIPSDDFVLNPEHGWAQLLQFKEDYTDASGRWHQDPLWAMGVHNFSGTLQGGLWPHDKRTFDLASYMDRWVQWEFRLYQGDRDDTGRGGRIELWADGELLDTGYESEGHVGSAARSPLSRARAWVWIAGPYTSNQTTNGVPDYRRTHVTTYVGPSRILPLA
ncbi:hypothetical protein [Friedmanniella luteola]|uniref:hypothetical protein n=1 Tax=Friedmanniella luteola TaxID=546871 RepID=UPI000B87754B|nr:hypothetical protein [Friedmanniella luteola]